MSFLIKIEVKKNLVDMDSQTRSALEKGINEASDFAIQQLQQDAPIRTGFLRSSFNKILFGTTARIYSIASYVMIVERGSRPHIIMPNKAKALHFMVGHEEVFAKSVRHPGTRGRFFIARTIDIVSRQAPKILSKQLSNVGRIDKK
jgi:hypothetical protein